MPELLGPPPRFDLQLLGDLCLRDLRTGERIGEARRKPLAVLAVLVASAPATVERDALLPLLWPELDLPHARRTLSQTLYALRQELGSEAVVVGSSHLTISPLLTSDLARWRLLKRAGDRAGCHREYRGPFLDGVHFRGTTTFDRWVAGWREQLEREQAVLMRTATAAPPSDSGHAPRDGSTSSIAQTSAAVAPSARVRRLGWVAVAVAVFVAAGAAALSDHAASRSAPPPATPATLAEEWRLTRQQEHATRLAATDSARIGRILLLPTLNRSRQPTLDTLLPAIDDMLRRLHEREFAQLLPPERSARFDREQQEWRASATTEMHMARMLQASGAGLVVRPVLQATEGGVFVSIALYRSIAHTSAARGGEPNVERAQAGGIETLALDGRDLPRNAAVALVRFTRSLERCDSASHLGAQSAPWCWGSPTTLDLVPGTATERQRNALALGRSHRAAIDSIRRERRADP
jgi:hypothetical protein